MESLETSSSHPNIKPLLIQRFASDRNQNEKNLIKYSISSSEQFRIQGLSHLNKQLPKTLISQHKLSNLSYNFKPQFSSKNPGLPTPITSFFSQIKNLQSLTTFTLKVFQSSHFHTQTCLKPLLMNLASLKNLSNLTIIFVNRLGDPKLLKMIFKYLQKIESLTALSITFWIPNKPLTSHLDVLSSGIRKLFQLRSLQLSIDEPPELQELLINKLAVTLPKLHFLTKISLRFNDDSFTSSSIVNLFSCFKSMKALSDITLALQSQPANNSKEPISQGLSLLDPSRIRKLNLQLYQHFDENSLIQFSEALRNFTSLQTLQLNLYLSNRTSKEELTALFSTLSSLVLLSSLIILLDAAKWKKSIEEISVPFKYLKNLTSLNLQIVGQISHEEFHELFSNLKLLKSLKFLALAYPRKGINDENLETLGESLKEILSLRSLSLDFSHGSLITNQGIEALACSIKTLKNLSSLKIWLRKNDNIDDKIIDQIIEILQGLPWLYSVDFNLLLCPKITCFNELLKAFKRGKNIGEIALSLPSEIINSYEIIPLLEDKVVKRMISF